MTTESVRFPALPPVRPLHVALVHSFYASASPSGENQAVADQARALTRAGHRVSVVAAHTDDLAGSPFHLPVAAWTVATGRGHSPLAELRRLSPDVVHVHNLFPYFGRAWAGRWRGPLVATLHNYRPLCASGTLHRAGAVCTLCPDGSRWSGLRLGCYRGSRTATLPLAWANRRGAVSDPLLDRADRLVVLSALSRDLYVRFGLPPRKLSLVPNFVEPAPSNTPSDGSGPSPEGTRWVFAGRLSEEKGILPLLTAWPDDVALDVIGAGPLEGDCRAAASGSVRFLGTLPRERLLAALPRYTGLIFPSTWFEPAMPLVCQEALAAGVPVLARAGSAAADSVLRHGTGAIYGGAATLPGSLAKAGRGFPALRDLCRRVHAEHYSPSAWVAAMTALYTRIVRTGGGESAATAPESTG